MKNNEIIKKYGARILEIEELKNNNLPSLLKSTDMTEMKELIKVTHAALIEQGFIQSFLRDL